MLDVNEVIAYHADETNGRASRNLWLELYTIANDRSQTPADRAKAIRHMDTITGVAESDGLTDAVLIERYEEMAIELGMMAKP